MTDLNAFAFTRKGNALIPTDVHASEFLSEIKEGKEVLVRIKKARSIKNHRRVFALLTQVLENTEQWGGDKEQFLQDLKIATGLCDRKVNAITGEPIIVPRSISFGSMDEISFKRWFRRAIYVCATQVLAVMPEDLAKAVDEALK